MSTELSKISIIAWLVENEIKTESGHVFDLYSHPFWYDILTDWHPQIALLKAAQMGGTSALSLKMIWAMYQFGLNVAYTMPTADDVKQFVGGRLNAMIRNNPVLDAWISDKDSVEQKRIGKNIAHFRGTSTERVALSFPADLLVHDEEDRSTKKIIEQYSSRQQHSPFKWRWHLSNPSTPGNGVDKYWLQSDQKMWHITCPSCQSIQVLTWPDSIDPTRGCYQCIHCTQELSDEVRRSGRWIATRPDQKEYSGYHLNLMMAPWVSAKEILKLHKTKSPEYFYNYVLGLPYAGSGNKLNEADFFANIKPILTKYDDPIVIGVDSGLPNYYVIGNKEGVFFHSHCNGWEEIKAVMKRFPKAIAVCDQGGDLYGQRNLQEEFPGRVYLCWFRQDRKTMRLVEWGKEANAGAVYADRNRCIQQVIDELRTHRLPMYGEKEDYLEVWQHFSNMYKEVEEDDTGQQKFVWKRSGADHLALCMTYYRIGMTKFESGDGSRYTGAPNKLQQFLSIGNAPMVLGDGRLAMPKPSQMENKDWRDID